MNGKRDFILANTRLIAPPLTPEIRLRLADEAVPIWKKTEDELGAMGLPPPFWAFAWAGGQALARYALDHADLVRGKRVLDFASGSGLVAIAAAKAGAAEVEASDIDAFAIAAIEANAAENGVAVAPAPRKPGRRRRRLGGRAGRRHRLRKGLRGGGDGLARLACAARGDRPDRRSAPVLPSA